jgi:hypothetical protein
MSEFFHIGTFERREIDAALYAGWQAAGNPKAAVWAPVPAMPPHDPETHDVTWGDGTWVVTPKPPPPVPESVTRFQARTWIFIRGVDLGLWATEDEMNAFMVGAISAQPGLTDIQREVAKIKWKEAGAIERFDPLVAALAPILNLPDQAAIDQALREAATL